MEMFLVWLVCSILVGIAADRHFNRNGLAWGFIAALISPLLGILLLLALGKFEKPSQQQELEKLQREWKQWEAADQSWKRVQSKG